MLTPINSGNNVFRVVGADAAGNVIRRLKIRRDTRFLNGAEPALLGLEACPRLVVAGAEAAVMLPRATLAS